MRFPSFQKREKCQQHYKADHAQSNAIVRYDQAPNQTGNVIEVNSVGGVGGNSFSLDPNGNIFSTSTTITTGNFVTSLGVNAASMSNGAKLSVGGGIMALAANINGTSAFSDTIALASGKAITFADANHSITYNSNVNGPLIKGFVAVGFNLSSGVQSFFSGSGLLIGGNTLRTISTTLLDLYGASSSPILSLTQDSASVNQRLQAQFSGSWSTNTDASRKARLVGTIYDTSARNWLQVDTDGASPSISLLGSLSNGTNLTTTGTIIASTGSFSGTVKASHFIGGTATPTIVAGVGAGTSPTISLTGSDSSGQITITTGTLPTGASSIVGTITLNQNYSSNPRVIWSVANGNAGLLSGASMISMDGASNNTFIITSGTTGLNASTTYIWNYAIIG